MHSHDNAEALLRVLNAPRRNKYFYGKRLDVQHFKMEQDYGKQKQWLLNRLTLGKGVLCGLRISVDGQRLCVDPGVAIDGYGREIIVPVRSCLDPVVQDESCCCGGGTTPKPVAPSPLTHVDESIPAAAPSGIVDGIFTLWLCYRECETDHQPVLVSECGTRDECSAGTIVESFCLKVAPGAPNFQGDPDWCAQLWPDKTANNPDVGHGKSLPGSYTHLSMKGTAVGKLAASDIDTDALRAAQNSRRHILCELFDNTCDGADENPCVPLALIVVRNGKVMTESCLVRPRIYSNQKLLDLILCLAEKIDDCCGKHNVELLRVRSVDFLNRSVDGLETPVTGIGTPLADTEVDIKGMVNSIRIRFSGVLATDQHKPSTPGLNDPDYELHNVQILAEANLKGLPYVPGSLVIEAPDTVRFDLALDSPYSRGAKGWQKGKYRIFLRGNEDLTKLRQALAEPSGVALDGEAITPAAGVISGDGTAGGDFNATFIVGGVAPAPLMRVASIDFLSISAAAGERVIGAVKTPLKSTGLDENLSAIRIRFDQPYARDALHLPATHGLNDPDFKAHNVLVRLDPEIAKHLESPYLPGTVVLEAADTLRFDVAQGSRVVDEKGQWPANLEVGCQLILRGTADPANKAPALANQSGDGLDGEPKKPVGGVMSGDGSAGGDFTARFSVLNNVIL